MIALTLSSSRIMDVAKRSSQKLKKEPTKPWMKEMTNEEQTTNNRNQRKTKTKLKVFKSLMDMDKMLRDMKKFFIVMDEQLTFCSTGKLQEGDFISMSTGKMFEFDVDLQVDGEKRKKSQA